MLTKFLFWFSKVYWGVNPVNLENINNQKQKVFFANHGSHLDTITILAALPENIKAKTRPVAAADYWGKNFLNRYISKNILNCVLINRNNQPTNDEVKINPLEPVYDALNGGYSVIIFPEGTRNTSEEPGEFKSGIYHLMQKYPEIEFVPVYLKNVGKSMPKGAFHPLPLICTIYFGNPMEKIENENKAEFLKRARSAVIELKG
jgi:1-acyl-sn-glycerol-3-phosphate acyltransferase